MSCCAPFLKEEFSINHPLRKQSPLSQQNGWSHSPRRLSRLLSRESVRGWGSAPSTAAGVCVTISSHCFIKLTFIAGGGPFKVEIYLQCGDYCGASKFHCPSIVRFPVRCAIFTKDIDAGHGSYRGVVSRGFFYVGGYYDYGYFFFWPSWFFILVWTMRPWCMVTITTFSPQHLTPLRQERLIIDEGSQRTKYGTMG